MNHTQKHAKRKGTIFTESWLLYAILLISFPLLCGTFWDLYYEIPSLRDQKQNLIRSQLLFASVYLFLFLFYNVVISASVRNRAKLNDTAQQQKKLENYLETLDQGIGDIRQHYQKYTNSVLKLKTCLDEDQVWHNDHSRFTDEEDYSNHDPWDSIADPLFSGLLRAKFKECRDLSISPSVFIETVPTLKPELHRMFIQIAGNLIDNAMEAASCTPEKQVEICCYKQGSALCFSVINSFVNDINPEKMFAEGYSCKGPNRGYGLAVVREYCRASRGILTMETMIDGGCVMQNLIIRPKTSA